MHFALLAALPLASIVEARLNLRQRMAPELDPETCCPCPGSDGTTTVTVTEPGHGSYVTETVTVEHTVTEPATTITQDHTITKHYTNNPDSPHETVTVITEGPGYGGHDGQDPEDDGEGEDDDMPPAVTRSELIKTVTVSKNHNKPSDTPSSGNNGDGEDVQTVTVTKGHGKPSDTPSSGDGGNGEHVKTITISKGHGKPSDTPSSGGDEDDENVVTVVTEYPSGGYGDGHSSKTMYESDSHDHVTVTTAPQETATIIQDHETTITRTVTRGGSHDVEVIIIDKETGEHHCHQKGSDLPCKGGDGDDSKDDETGNGGNGGSNTVSCDPSTSFSTSTVYNTVSVTVSEPETTPATPTATPIVTPPAAGNGTYGSYLRKRASSHWLMPALL